MIDFAKNPMLEDDDEVIESVLNPMLEDEDEEVAPVVVNRFGDLRKVHEEPQAAKPVTKIVRPPATPSVSAPVAQPSAPVVAPVAQKKGHRFTGPVSKPENIGKPGYDSLGRKHTPSPRFKPTEKDARCTAHLAKWRIGYAEDLGELDFAEPTPMNLEPGLLSGSTITKRLSRLRAKGYVGTKRDKRGKTVWGATQDGIDLARSWGFLERDSDAHPKVFTDMGWSPSDHFLQISRVAARLASPAGLFRDSLGIGPVAQSNLLAEHQLRAGFARGTSQWSALTKDGAEADYPTFWEDVLAVAKQKVAEGRLAWSDMLAAYPMLWTIGNYGEEKQAHFCDLIVNLEAGRNSAVSQSILVEVELSIKEWDDYVALLTSFAHRLSTLDVVGKVVYFVPTNKVGRDIEKMLRAVDRAEDLGLFESNRFLVLPIFNRDGSELKLRRNLGD